MVNQQALAEQWSEVRDQIHDKWHHISTEDLPSFPGNVDQLVGNIQQRTGESREVIEDFLATLTDDGRHLAAGARSDYAMAPNGFRKRPSVESNRCGKAIARPIAWSALIRDKRSPWRSAWVWFAGSEWPLFCEAGRRRLPESNGAAWPASGWPGRCGKRWRPACRGGDVHLIRTDAAKSTKSQT